MNHKVTAIIAQKRNRLRVNVYLDGSYAFALTRLVVAWLEVGSEIDDEKISRLLADDAREMAYQQALKYLGYRPRTESEVRQNLQDHEIPEEVVEATILRLQQGGLLDDQHFAQTWVENRNEFRPRGGRALAYELHRRGVSDQVIEQTLTGLDEEELAYQAALKYSRKISHLSWQDFRQKMYGFLARRGFNYEVSNSVSARAWEQIHPASSNDHLSKTSGLDDLSDISSQ
jgi:regulatory protein